MAKAVKTDNVVSLPQRRGPHQIVFVNGPRHSGKDTFAVYAEKHLLNVRKAKFAEALKLGCKHLFNIDDATYREFEEIGSKMKLEPRPELFGMSWVDTLIMASEQWMKPSLGNGAFGYILANKLAHRTIAPCTIVTDCGFEHEILPVVTRFGAECCHLVRLHRPGFTFAGDSRGYVFLDNDRLPTGMTAYDIDNDDQIDIFELKVQRVMNKILKRPM